MLCAYFQLCYVHTMRVLEWVRPFVLYIVATKTPTQECRGRVRKWLFFPLFEVEYLIETITGLSCFRFL